MSQEDQLNRNERIKASARASKNKLGRPAVYFLDMPFDKLGIHNRKARVLHEQNHKCLHCDQGEAWNGLPLVLQLDHIDGNRKNNLRENLRGLCPNCHSQTPTYAIKKVHLNRRMATLEGIEPPTTDS